MKTIEPSKSGTLLLVALLATVALIGIVGFFYLQSVTTAARKVATDNLTAVAESKVREIVNWRVERLSDARAVMQNPFLTEPVQRFLTGPADAASTARLTQWLQSLQEHNQALRAILVDAECKVRLVFPVDKTYLGPIAGTSAKEAMVANHVTMSELHLSQFSGEVHLDMVVPIHPTVGAAPVGAVVLEVDPEQFLFPLIQTWPTASPSAETLLIRQEGNDVLYLNELRHRKGTALVLRLPLGDKDLPAARAVRGETGEMAGVDYRGVPVLANVRVVPGTKWFMVAKVDQTEVNAPLRRQTLLISVCLGLLILAIGLGFGLVWRHQRVLHYREKVEAVEAMRASELRYRRLFETAKDGILILDAETGMIVDVNLFLINLLGYSHEVFLGKKVWELGFFKNIVANEANFAELQAKKYIRYEDMPLETADGRRIDVEFVSNVYLVNSHKVIQCNIRDITARKLVEVALRQSEKRFRILFERAADSILLLEITPEGIPMIRDANSAAFKILGYDRNELLDKPVSFIEPVPDAFQVVEKRRQDIVSGKGNIFELQHRCKNGAIRDFECSVSELQLGSRTFAISVERDITDRKLADHALRQSNRRLNETLAELRRTQQVIVQQESLRAMGQMASGIAHDFNNTLSPIIGFSELILNHPEQLADPEQVAKSMRIIHTCANDAASVVRRMHEFSRRRAPGDVSEVFDLSELVRQTIEHTQPRWKDQAQANGLAIHIETDLQNVPPVTGEGFAIRELLTNLIFNAVDALPNGGTIKLGTAVDGRFVRLWVGDNGIGMTDEVRRHCLEPFFSTKGNNGTGLGLSMVHGIVERHDGTIEITSEPGRGTTFTVRLPIHRAMTEPTVPVVASAMERKLRVLVVDDQPALCEIVEAYLTSDGHAVVTAGGGEAALARFKDGRFDVVITDKAMPGINGEELAAAIHLSDPGMPVILMTGFGEMMKAAGEMPQHISTILSKPFTLATLRAALVTAVGEASGVSKTSPKS